MLKHGSNNTVLVIGATGYIGTQLCEYLASRDFLVMAAVRRYPSRFYEGVRYIVTGDYTKYTDWSELLESCANVIFAAGLAHDKKDTEKLDVITQMNAVLPYEIAKCAIEKNVEKFIFLSSIKVNGEITELGEPFGEQSEPAPCDKYGFSKMLGEEKLCELQPSNTQIAIIRLPLVVGLGAKGNVGLIHKMISKRLPIPVKNIDFNSRSIILLDELCMNLCHMLTNRSGINGVHFIKHNRNLSTKEIVQLIGELDCKKAILFSLPMLFLKTAFFIFKLERLKTQLLCNLEIISNYKISETDDAEPHIR